MIVLPMSLGGPVCEAAARNAVPKDAKNEIVSPCVRKTTETFAASVCPRGYVCH